MFCRRCYYDLRGQRDPRCPECGTAFAFDDPSSFLGEKPRMLGRILARLRRRRRVLLGALTFLLLISYGFGYSSLRSHSHAVHPRVLATVNLKGILTTWAIQRYDHPEQAGFDVDAARRDMRPSLSPWSEGRAAHWRALMTRFLTFAAHFVVPTIVYVLAVAILIGGRVRRGAFALGATLSLVLWCSIYPHELARRLLPGSHAFLDDYVYLPGAYASRANSAPGQTIVAYDVNSFRGAGPRIIGFADGHVMSFWGERAKPIFEVQGIPHPKPD